MENENMKEGILSFNTQKRLVVKYFNEKKKKDSETNVSINIQNKDKLEKLIEKSCKFELIKSGNEVIKIIIDNEIFDCNQQAKASTANTLPKVGTPIFNNQKNYSNSQQSKEKSISEIGETKLPKDTRGNLPKNIDNFSLRLNKTVYFDDEGKPKFYGQKNKDDKSKYKIDLKIKPEIIKNISKKQDNIINTISKNNNIEKIDLITQGRLIIGLGSESVYETAITLHHIYGIPYIPSSSIKGVLRNYIIMNEFENLECKALKEKWFCDIFGSDKDRVDKESRGKIIFFDSFPIDKIELDFDIVNPHYTDYYSGKKNPTDDMKPVPIPFITVASDTKFRFIIASKEENRELLTNVKAFLIEALENQGIGAKTSVGYGYMNTSQNYKKPIDN